MAPCVVNDALQTPLRKNAKALARMATHREGQVGYPAPPLMPEFAGSPQSVIVSQALFVLLAIPILGLLAELGRAAGALYAGRADGSERIVRATVAATALATVAFAAQLLSQNAGDKYLLQHLVPWIRAGELDANLDLALDPLACLALVVVLGAVGMSAFRTVTVPAAAPASATATATPSARARTSSTGVLVVLLGAVLAILSVDLFGILLGLAIALAGLVTTRTGRRQAQVGFASLALLGGASALFFWGMGGEFQSDGFSSDFRARLASVQVGRADELRAPSVRGEGLLTVTAYPGSPVFMDDAHTPLLKDGVELLTPFARFPVHAGVHSFRVHPGLGQDDELLTQIPMGEGRELMLVPVGSTLAPRQIADQLVLEEASGGKPLRVQVLKRTFAGHGSVLQVASLLAVAFALVWAFAATRGRAAHRDAAVRAVAGLLGAYVLARLAAVVAPSFGGSGGATGWVSLLVALALVAGATPLLRGRIEPELEKDDGTEPLAHPAFLASLAASVRPLSERLVPEVGGESPALPPSLDPRAKTLDLAIAALLTLGLLAALVAGR